MQIFTCLYCAGWVLLRSWAQCFLVYCCTEQLWFGFLCAMALRLWSWCRSITWQCWAMLYFKNIYIKQKVLSNAELTLMLSFFGGVLFFVCLFLSLPPLVSCNVWDVTNGLREWAHSNPDEERQQDGAPCKCGVCKAGIHLGGCAASRPVSCSVMPPPRYSWWWITDPGWLIWQRQPWSRRALSCRCVRCRTGFKGAAHKRFEAGAWQISHCFQCSQRTQAALGGYMCYCSSLCFLSIVLSSLPIRDVSM